MIDFNSASLTGTFGYVSSLDDALDKPRMPADPTEEQRKEYGRAMEEFEHRLKVAHETGNFDAIPTVEGKQPVVFRLRHPSGRNKARVRGLVRQFQTGDPVEQELAVFDLVTHSLASVVIGGETIDVNGDEQKIAKLYDHDKGATMFDLARAVAEKLVPSGN